MNKYKVNEIFYSLQGEGARAGTPNVFVRFSDCNLTCNFCDTEFESGTEMTAKEIADKVMKLMPEPRAVILTGGEPLMQYDEDLYKTFREIVKTRTICVETNGSMKPKASIDWITCSPKVAEHVLAQNFKFVHELKYVRHKGQAIPEPLIDADHFYLSPIFNGNMMDRDNLEYCIKLVKENPRWKLSTQQHKLWKVR